MQSRDDLRASRDALDAAAGARAREYWTCVRAHFTAVRAGTRDAARVSRRQLDALALEIFGAHAVDGTPRAGYRTHEAFVEHLYGMLRQAKMSTSAVRTTPDVDVRRRVGLLEASGDVATTRETNELPTTAIDEPPTATGAVESVKDLPPSVPTTSAPRAKRARALPAYPKSLAAAVKSASTSFGIPLGAPRNHSSSSVDRLQARARVMRRDIAASVRVREDVVEVLRAATRARVLAVTRAALEARDAFGLAGIHGVGSERVCCARVTLKDCCLDCVDVVGVTPLAALPLAAAYTTSRSSARHRRAAT